MTAAPTAEIINSLAVRWVARSGVLAAFLVAILVMPFVALSLPVWAPNLVANLLFFGPQFVYPTAWSGGSTNHYALWSVPIWVVSIILFGFLCRRSPIARAVWLAPVVILVVTVGLHILMSVFGFSFELDGP